MTLVRELRWTVKIVEQKVVVNKNKIRRYPRINLPPEFQFLIGKTAELTIETRDGKLEGIILRIVGEDGNENSSGEYESA